MERRGLWRSTSHDEHASRRQRCFRRWQRREQRGLLCSNPAGGLPIMGTGGPMAKMLSGASPLLLLLLRCWLAATFLWAPIRGCPEPCACVDKYAQQFADCAYKNLEAVPSGLPSNVTTLSLSANKIAELRRGSFVEVTQVTSLWLAHNRIGVIEEGTLAILVQLKNLDVSHNQIADFPWGDLRNLSALQLLKMNNNRMSHLPGEAFRTLRDLRSLRINNNRFSEVAEGTFDALTSLSHLQIYNNPFNCTCQLMWLKNWTENTLISIPDRNAITCAAPESWKGLPLAKVPYLHCAPPIVRLSYHPNLDRTRLSYGLALALHCHALGLPQPEVTWRIQAAGETLEIKAPAAEGEGNALPSDGWSRGDRERFQAFGNGTLLIPHLSKKEEGTYTCLAANEMGSNQSSVHVAVADAPAKDSADSLGDRKAQPGDRKPEGKASKNSVMKAEERTKLLPERPTPRSYHAPGPRNASGPSGPPLLAKQCGSSEAPQYVSNHAFNRSGALKPHSFDLGVIALDVSEREAKVQITPFYAQPEKVHLRRLYLCEAGRRGHSLVQWSQIEEGVNSYWFQGLSPGTNYSVCMSYVGEDCQVQVVFTTKREVPSLVIIVVVSVFLLGLATIPLLGATCCHLLSKYQGKTYKLIMKAQNPDQMEKHMAADFDPRASYLESEKNYDPSEVGEGEEEEEEEARAEGEAEGRRGLSGGRQLERDESLAASSIPESQSKTNPEEFEVGSEYSDRLPLGAEAVTISQEINGNYRQPPR
ncbi:immunoglobulin superfamily containing leucine-rich repeat protein 2 isoform X1 [Podarcis raffonei]|uniref:immunoglobulin superfamily containing leucine-rich repeat protein 2 isoform X1 n=1 Tax=Podarcis raffonei TaxID=65483 RepID=UPI002329548F|nr:immunoglobulin superfamily containing leucine-rich repeat protein 2 isoform X1 [Podarcis raffonei]